MISHRGPMLKCNISTTEIISVPSNVSEIKQMSPVAVRMPRHVILNLFCPFPDIILSHFKTKPPAEMKLFHFKTISH